MASLGHPLAVLLLLLAAPAAADLNLRGGRRLNGSAPEQKRRLKVVTDMGFDDWGALASLHAAGLEPEAILATNGMMKPTEFYLTFKDFLQAWGIQSPVYQGTERCYDEAQCLSTSLDSFIDGWGYRENVRSFFQSPMPVVPAKSQPDAEFWEAGGCEEKYTLLVLSPASDVALAVSAKPDRAECIEEIVLAGGTFDPSALQQYDNITWKDVLIMVNDSGVVPPDYYAQPFRNAELNVAADAPAAAFMLGLGVRVIIVPLEVDSIARPGLQKKLDDGDEPDGDGSQWRKDVFLQNKYLMQGLCGSRPQGHHHHHHHQSRQSMLEHMACINKGEGDVHTLDMDAITAAYLFSKELFDLEPGHVEVNRTTGITSLVDSCSSDAGECHEVQVATAFNATAWVQQLRAMV